MREKLTELEMHRLQEAQRNSSELLRTFKQRRLSNEGVDWMKMLEESVNSLSALLLIAGQH